MTLDKFAETLRSASESTFLSNNLTRFAAYDEDIRLQMHDSCMTCW